MENIKKNSLINEVEALILSTSNKADIDDCPIGGDATDCRSCVYGCDYFYFNGECKSRNYCMSKWKQVHVLRPIYSGTNNEIKSIPIMGWTDNKTYTGKNGNIIAVIWEDLSDKNSKGVNYKDEAVKSDDYVLTYIIEELRKL